jgi:hypothetical protein
VGNLKELMKAYKFGLLLIFIVSTLFAIGQDSFTYDKDYKRIVNDSKKPKSDLNYNKLLKRFLENDTSLTNYELIALQIGHTQTADYEPYEDIEIERAIYDLNASGKNRAALELSNSLQRRNPLSLMMNLEKSYAFHKLEQPDSSGVYYQRYLQLVHSDLWSGNGEDIPYFVLGPIDGQIIIKRYWQGEITSMGSGGDDNGNFLDILTMKDNESEEEKTIYFIIQHATDSMFSEEDEQKMEEYHKQSKKKK